MAFYPQVKQTITLDGRPYSFTEHPSAQGKGIPYGQSGRRATVYQLVAEDLSHHALKVFNYAYRESRVAWNAEQLRAFAGLPGLQVCDRKVLIPEQYPTLLQDAPDLAYAVLMPWVYGSTWQEVIFERRTLTQEAAQKCARSLAYILAVMEENSLAHCDISGGNVMLPGLAEDRPPSSGWLALVDIEDVYFPGLNRPENVVSGSAGYGHPRAGGAVWSPVGDRFAAAVMLAEMLAWPKEPVRAAADSEQYFDNNELQKDCPRFELLREALREDYGRSVMTLFEQAWRSPTLADCPPLRQWRDVLGMPDEARPAVPATRHAPLAAQPVPHVDASAVTEVSAGRLQQVQNAIQRGQMLLEVGDTARAVKELGRSYRLAPGLVAETYAGALMSLGIELDDASNLSGALAAFEKALQVAPPGGMRDELPFMIADLKERIDAAAPTPLEAGAQPIAPTGAAPAAAAATAVAPPMPRQPADPAPDKTLRRSLFVILPILVGCVILTASFLMMVWNPFWAPADAREAETPTLTPTETQSDSAANELAAAPVIEAPPTDPPTATPTPEPTAEPSATPETVTVPGGRIAVVSDHDGSDRIYLLNIRGGTYPVAEVASAKLVESVTPVNASGGISASWWPEWCENNQKILFEGQMAQGQTVYEVAVDDPSAEARAIVPMAQVANFGLLGTPNCSHNGELLILSGQSMTTKHWKLLSFDYRTRQFRGEVFSGAAAEANMAWAPDSASIVLMAIDQEGEIPGLLYHLKRQATAAFGSGSAERINLEITGYFFEKLVYPSISPQNGDLAFGCRDQSKVWHLCASDGAGRSTRVLQSNTVPNNDNSRPGKANVHVVTPSWSPDGGWIAYTSNKDGDWDIYLVNAAKPEIEINLTGDLYGGANQFHPKWSKP